MKDRDRLIELLREARERYIYTEEQADHLLANGARLTEAARAEAIREFAKFLIDKAKGNTILIGDLPDFVKEMTEGEK